jgi:hypothetical protein
VFGSNIPSTTRGGNAVGGCALSTVALVIALTFIALLTVCFPVMFILTWFRIGRKAATIGAGPIPVVATLCRTSLPYEPLGKRSTLTPLGVPSDRKVEFRWTDPTTGQMFFDVTVFTGSTQPFCLDAARTKMLALASGSGQAYLLDAALATVDLEGSRALDGLRSEKCDGLSAPPV